jgi:hypothetical protein
MGLFLEGFEADDGMDPVLKAGVAHFWFVTIHPFEDGNGRIGRAIVDLALARADDTAERFYSMSSQMEAERKESICNWNGPSAEGSTSPSGSNGSSAVWGVPSPRRMKSSPVSCCKPASGRR